MKTVNLLNFKKLFELREAKGLSQEQAALAAGLSGRSAWCNIESGKQPITLATLGRLAFAVGCQPADLLLPLPSSMEKPKRAPAARRTRRTLAHA